MTPKIIEKAIQRFTKAYTLSGKAKLKEVEKDLEGTIKRGKKLKFMIERQLYNKEAAMKYNECREAIEKDQSISIKEKDKYLKDLEELFIFDL